MTTPSNSDWFYAVIEIKNKKLGGLTLKGEDKK
jgi:hypothetical protein